MTPQKSSLNISSTSSSNTGSFTTGASHSVSYTPAVGTYAKVTTIFAKHPNFSGGTPTTTYTITSNGAATSATTVLAANNASTIIFPTLILSHSDTITLNYSTAGSFISGTGNIGVNYVEFVNT